MMAAVFDEHFRDLLRSRDSKIPNHTAMQCMRIVSINDLAHEISAVSFYEVVALQVGLLIELTDQQCILLWACLNLEGINCPVISRPDQLIPVSLWRSSVGAISGKRFQMIATILISQETNQLGIGEKRDCFRSLNCIEIGDERNRNPIMSGDAVVSAQHYAGFTLGTPTQNYRRLGTNVAQVDGHVARSGESAVVAIGLFEK